MSHPVKLYHSKNDNLNILEMLMCKDSAQGSELEPLGTGLQAFPEIPSHIHGCKD